MMAWIGLDRQNGCEVTPIIVELKSGGFLRAQTQERGPHWRAPVFGTLSTCQ